MINYIFSHSPLENGNWILPVFLGFFCRCCCPLPGNRKRKNRVGPRGFILKEGGLTSCPPFHRTSANQTHSCKKRQRVIGWPAWNVRCRRTVGFFLIIWLSCANCTLCTNVSFSLSTTRTIDSTTISKRDQSRDLLYYDVPLWLFTNIQTQISDLSKLEVFLLRDQIEGAMNMTYLSF